VLINLFTFQGANFRDLPGLIVGPDNVAKLDPKMDRILLPSGKPLVCQLSTFHYPLFL
jgi:hypothetical protein